MMLSSMTSLESRIRRASFTACSVIFDVFGVSAVITFVDSVSDVASPMRWTTGSAPSTG